MEREQEKPEERLPKETRVGEGRSHHLPDPQGREEKGVDSEEEGSKPKEGSREETETEGAPSWH